MQAVTTVRFTPTAQKKNHGEADPSPQPGRTVLSPRKNSGLIAGALRKVRNPFGAGPGRTVPHCPTGSGHGTHGLAMNRPCHNAARGSLCFMAEGADRVDLAPVVAHINRTTDQPRSQCGKRGPDGSGPGDMGTTPVR